MSFVYKRSAEKFGHIFCSATEAIRRIKTDDRIFVGSGATEPLVLVKEMTAQAERIRQAEIIHILTLGETPYIKEKYSNVFRHNALFIGSNVREAVSSGRADYTSVFLSEIPKLLHSDDLRPDVALIQVSAPDDNGYCSLGASVDVVRAGYEAAKTVIAEVNPRMPYTFGDSFIHLSEIQAAVVVDYPLPEMVFKTADETALKIGALIAREVEDGSTLQMGIGMIPNAVLANLKQKNDLGIHTEMFSDGIIELVESGVINGRRKTLHPKKAVTSFCFGSASLYDYVNRNPFFEFHPSEYVNDPFVIAQNDRMVAINSALEIDLTGQVCSDSLGSQFYSGIGGQVDFIRGAARSKGGKPIIAITSTAKNGAYSRIVPGIKEYAGVVTTRGDVHYVATEFGMVNLWGKNMRERAMALLSIAHPDFHESLMDAAKQRKIL